MGTQLARLCHSFAQLCPTSLTMKNENYFCESHKNPWFEQLLHAIMELNRKFHTGRQKAYSGKDENINYKVIDQSTSPFPIPVLFPKAAFLKDQASLPASVSSSTTFKIISQIRQEGSTTRFMVID